MGMLYSPHHSHQARGGLSPGRVNHYEEILPGEQNETRALSHGRDPERMQVEASSPPQRHAEPGRDGGGAAEPREHGSAKLSACRIKPHLSEHLWNFLSNVPMNAAVFSQSGVPPFATWVLPTHNAGHLAPQRRAPRGSLGLQGKIQTPPHARPLGGTRALLWAPRACDSYKPLSPRGCAYLPVPRAMRTGQWLFISSRPAQTLARDEHSTNTRGMNERTSK